MSDDSVWVEIGDRVRESRIAAGLSQEQLARRASSERSKIAKIEAGTRQINAVELTKLATALDMPLGHFLYPRPTVVSRRSPLDEDTTTVAARESYRMEATLAGWLRDVADVRDVGELRIAERLQYGEQVGTAEDARAAAQWVRQRLGYGAEPIPTMMAACQAAGQLVLVVDVPGDGASVIDGDVAVAVVSRVGDPGRRRATAAHELGHMVLGDEYSSDLGGGVAAAKSDREAVIDAFAAEFLLPADALRTVVGDNDLRAGLVTGSARYRTSWTLTLRQALAGGLIEKRDLSRWRGAPKPTRAELMQAVGWAPQPDLENVRVPPDYADAVLAAWRERKVTARRAIELLHGQLAIDDLAVIDEEDVVDP
ncbi:helix-turn-helix domain-containing protein [Nocardia rhizosphaerae]|uniref:Helix-turn-helix domain-containing protein n=1 Tax=Nocardia rhizosphaerae TaxID=1691571 RepID=A0ABV8L4B3_9NOCA